MSRRRTDPRAGRVHPRRGARAELPGRPAEGSWLEGLGLHTGARCRLRLRAAPPGSGLLFVRVDLGGARIPASPESVVETDRRTVLGAGGASVSTVEHVLAAVSGVGLWDAVLEVDGPEVPALDGSALPFALAALPLARSATVPAPIRLGRPLTVSFGRSWATALPADRPSVSCRVCFDHPAVGTMRARWHGSPRAFLERVAPARTFGFLDELHALRSRGLAAGGGLDNALVYDASGPLLPERMAGEPARHKLLDALGDLALLGRPLLARVRLERPGHGLLAALVSSIAAEGARYMPQKPRQVSAP